MSYPTNDTIDGQILTYVDKWLDDKVYNDYKDQPLAQHWARVAKVAEELGEAISCLIGVTGQNPRKGFTHTREQLLDELADTAITAIFAIQHFTKQQSDTRQIIREKMDAIYRRAYANNENNS